MLNGVLAFELQIPVYAVSAYKQCQSNFRYFLVNDFLLIQAKVLTMMRDVQICSLS